MQLEDLIVGHIYTLKDVPINTMVEAALVDLEGEGDGTDGEAIVKILDKESPYYTVKIIEGKYNNNINNTTVLLLEDTQCKIISKNFSYKNYENKIKRNNC